MQYRTIRQIMGAASPRRRLARLSRRKSGEAAASALNLIIAIQRFERSLRFGRYLRRSAEPVEVCSEKVDQSLQWHPRRLPAARLRDRRQVDVEFHEILGGTDPRGVPTQVDCRFIHNRAEVPRAGNPEIGLVVKRRGCAGRAFSGVCDSELAATGCCK